jgi:hypothetical protein
MENLLTTLTPGDKSMILVPRRAVVAVEEPTHQPQINEFKPSTYKQRQLAKLTLYKRMNFHAQDKRPLKRPRPTEGGVGAVHIRSWKTSQRVLCTTYIGNKWDLAATN